MSELDDVKQAVEEARNEVTSAKSACEQAQQVAADKMNAMAGLGLEGVAQVLNAASDALSTSVAQLASAYSVGDEAVSALSSVSDGAQVSQTVTALNTAGQKLGNAGTEAQGAMSQADTAMTYAQQSEVEPVTNAVANAVNVISQTQTSLATATTKASAHAQKIEQSAKDLIANSSGGGQTAPPAQREPIAKVGDKLEEPQLGPAKVNPFKAELNNSDDDDTSKFRSSRLGRSAVRNAEALHKQSKETTKTLVINDRGFFDPPVEDTHASVGVADPPPRIVPAVKEASVVDGVSSGIVMTVFAVEAFTRRFRK